MKKIFLVFSIIIFFNLSLIPRQLTPIIIPSQKYVFNKISKDIAKIFPDNVEILVYDINLLNADQKIIKKLNDNFYNLITANQSKYNFITRFERDIAENNNVDMDYIKKQSELDLIAFGQFLNLDVVLFSSATIIEDQTKKIWNKELKKIVNKKIILFQGDFISTENSLSIFRFSYYFLMD